jgi:hypothetical protein
MSSEAMMAKSMRAGGRSEGGSDAQVLVHLVRELTEAQFDFWIACLNRAVAVMGGKGNEFGRDDRQKTISYWYVLMFLLEIYAAGKNPFEVKESDVWLSEGLVSMKALSRHLRDRYQQETVRRYVSDLKRCGLIAHQGRGPEAMVKLSAPAIAALTDTIRQWMTAFRDLDRRYGKMWAT